MSYSYSLSIINALGHHFPQLQSDIHGMTDDPNFNWATAIRHIDTEAALVQRHVEVGVAPTTVTLLGTSGSDSKGPGSAIVCSNCKHLHHTIDFCIKPGGKMAGHTLEEAKAAQCAAAGKAPQRTRGSMQSGSANVATATTSATLTTNTTATTNATTTTPSNSALTTVTAVPTNSSGGSPVVINGVLYILVPTPTNPPQQTANLCDHTGVMYRVNDLLDFSSMIAEMGPHRTSLNWGHYTKVADPSDTNASYIALPSTPFIPLHLLELPFILDTGTICHILPEHSNFQNLKTIQPYPIKGLGGTCVYAMGMGMVKLTMEDGHCLTLHDALFIPSSSV